MLIVLFLFRWCSLNNVAVFEKFQPTDIDHVESRLKSELAVQLLSDVEEEEKCHFLGRFATNPDNFKFNLGERRLIEIFGTHLRDLSTKPGELNRFKVNDVNIKKHDRNRIQLIDNDLIQTSIGVVFRKLPAATDGVASVSKILPKIDDIKQSLFMRVSSYYANFKDDLKKSEFSEDDVLVTITNNQIDAAVLCIFCDRSEKRDVKVFCRRIDGLKSIWVLSNLTKHEDRFHQIGINQKVNVLQKENPESTPDNDIGKTNKLRKPPLIPATKKTRIMNFDALNENRFDLSSNENDNIEMIVCDLNDDSPKNDACKTNATNSNGAIPTDETNQKLSLDEEIKRFEDILYTAVYSQMLRMENCVKIHNEDTKEFVVSKTTRKKSKSLVKVVKIDADGNCLFYALAHQLFYVKKNSKQHIELADKLRRQVVEHVCNNIDPFLHGLKDRLIEYRLEWKDDLRGSCLRFVREEISKDGFWGGEETLKATAEIFRVNILLILDRDTCILGNRFDPTYERALVLSYIAMGNTLNHFESICEMINDSQVNYVSKVMELEKNSVLFQEEIFNCNNFVID